MSAPIFAKFEPVLWLLLGGAIVWGFSLATDKKTEKAQKATASHSARQAAVAQSVAKGTQVEVEKTEEGDLITLYVPSKGVGGLYVEVKRCLVWRDAVTKTSSMSCPPDVDDRDLIPDDPPDIDPR